ncbi:MAG: class I SAM-dependent methyltransferase [Candidatus Thermoplasmatota archaeon]|nr:class I SAM-dependent methyltransferase [Candidatus Thermoplasmatota archaeon]
MVKRIEERIKVKPELEKIKDVYKKYEEDNRYKIKWSQLNPGNVWIVEEREQTIISLFKKYKLEPLSDKKILDVGCGRGGFLRTLLKYGTNESNLYGIDLSKERIGGAKKEIIKLFPHCSFDFNLITLLPPLTRKLAPYSLKLCQLLEQIQFLRTH